MRLLIIPLLIFWMDGLAQCKTYKLSAKGDTLNCIDLNNLRQGRWIVRMPALRGEPGYEEEGFFKDDKKEGLWRRFNLMGDMLAAENYRWGLLNGKSQYFTLAGLEREESWKAANPNKPLDTIDVADPTDPTKIERVAIRLEGSSVKHGEWKYYDPVYGRLVKKEEYFLGRLRQAGEDNKNFNVVTDSSSVNKSATGLINSKDANKEKDKNKPKQVLEFEKKVKKGAKVRDGRTGG